MEVTFLKGKGDCLRKIQAKPKKYFTHGLPKTETPSPDLHVYILRVTAANQGLIQVPWGLGTLALMAK